MQSGEVVAFPKRNSRARIFEDPQATLRRKYLTEKEQIFYEDPPAALSLILSFWWLWAIFAGAVWYIFVGGLDGLPLALFVILATLAFAGWQVLQRYYTRYVITSLRVLRMRGVITRSVDWMPLGRITDITFKQNPFERVLGFADLRIHSASEATGLRDLQDVADPARFHRILTYCVEAKNSNVTLTDEAQQIIRAAGQGHR